MVCRIKNGELPMGFSVSKRPSRIGQNDRVSRRRRSMARTTQLPSAYNMHGSVNPRFQGSLYLRAHYPTFDVSACIESSSL